MGRIVVFLLAAVQPLIFAVACVLCHMAGRREGEGADSPVWLGAAIFGCFLATVAVFKAQDILLRPDWRGFFDGQQK